MSTRNPNSTTRWANSRLSAAILMALASMGTVYTGLSLHTLEEGASERPVYVAGVVAGTLAGWLNMQRGLGGGFARAALGGVSAGVTGTIYFLILAGVYETVHAYRYTQFNTATALLDNLVLQMIDVFWIAAAPPTLLTILIGGATAGMYSEHVRRAWG